MFKVFIDGKEGTTGLKIFSRLEKRTDIELLVLKEELRKDIEARKSMMNKADLVFLCLPDQAAIEAVSLIDNPNVKVIDASTAHRTNPNWVYGFPELGPEYERQIKTSKRVANPGCHATGFTSLVVPLIKENAVDPDYPFTCFSITGYSGGGKKMINEYENSLDPLLKAPRLYGLNQNHKHLKEMTYVCGLERSPIFTPIVAPYLEGMTTTITLFPDLMKHPCTLEEIHALYEAFYKDQKCIRVMPINEEMKFLGSNQLAGKDYLEIYVFGTDERITISSCFDNLGKGASGEAIYSMNLMLGLDPFASLEL